MGRIDDMGSKIDELENSINDLMDQAKIESTSDGPAKNDRNVAKATAKR